MKISVLWSLLIVSLLLISCGVPETAGSSAISLIETKAGTVTPTPPSASIPFIPAPACVDILPPQTGPATTYAQPSSGSQNDDLLVMYKGCEVSYAQLKLRQEIYCHDYVGRRQFTCFDTVEERLRDLLERSSTGMVISTTLPAAPASDAPREPTPTPDPSPPPNPPWVLPNGLVDLAKVPACLGMANRKGATVRDEDGQPVCIPSKELFAPPPPPPGVEIEQERDATPAPAPNAAEDFAFSFRYRPCGSTDTDVLDTFANTYTKTPLGESASFTIPLRLSDSQLATIRQKIVTINFFSYPEQFRIANATAAVTPAATYHLTVRDGADMKTVEWTDDVVEPITPEAERLRELFRFIRGLIETNPEIQKLPEPKAACL